MQAIDAELSRCQEQLRMLTAPVGRKLIISTGDISDADGFFALAKYAQTGADVLFIMNYPAYIDTPLDEKESECPFGMGYRYNIQTITDKWIVDHPEVIGHPMHTKLQTIKKIQQFFKRVFSTLAHEMAFQTWEASETTGNLYFCIGGVNDIDPFSTLSCSHELFIYRDLYPANEIVSLPTEGLFFGRHTQCKGSVHDHVHSYDEIYMDFNGSMAFLNVQWEQTLLRCIAARKLKAVVVQGGVFSHEAPKTVHAIPGKLNRMSCATMNQLYSPSKTSVFFQLLQNTGVHVYVAANNVTHTLQKTDWKPFLDANGIVNPYLERICGIYYPTKANAKLFDFYTALAVSRLIDGHAFCATASQLFYEPIYGVSILGDGDWKSTRDAFKRAIPEDKKDAYKQELETLDTIQCTSIPIKQLKFNLDPCLQLIIQDEPYVKLQGRLVPIANSNGSPLTEKDLAWIQASKAFDIWSKEFDFPPDVYKVNKINVQWIDRFGPKPGVGFLKFHADVIKRSTNTKPPGIVFMRGHSVAMLTVVKRASDRKLFTILTVQPRVPIGKHAFTEIPAGMMDAENNFAGVAAKELKEELHLTVNITDLQDMAKEAGIEHGLFYLSPGGCDEGIRFMLYETTMSDEALAQCQGRLTGNLEENEEIKLRVAPLEDIAKHCPDAKSLTALYLFSRIQERRRVEIQ